MKRLPTKINVRLS